MSSAGPSSTVPSAVDIGSISHSQYTVGWICALPKEQTAATIMLDEIHPDLDKPPHDDNTYTLGSIGKHNVVIACLPKGIYGNVSATTAANHMINTFPSVKVGLMVGIGGGIPLSVKLGDVVVSIPVRQYPGVVQWDFGRAENGGKFNRTGQLDKPPRALLTAVGKLETKHQMHGSKIQGYIKDLKERYPNLDPSFTQPASPKDLMLPPDNSHHSQSGDWGEYKHNIRIHYGLIASGNQVIKDAELRDRINDDLEGNVLCVEMEAAGLMNDFPCIVIRGICDYADSHKNDDWQEYAAVIAAGYARELLEIVQPSDVRQEHPAKDIVNKG
ncbi:nucleoside phosphorylase domain-containing protein [Hypoxylon sp. NC1633]|nr:nucleoside phosphorylase domain-containing protein [Hypoxylon sp. NC1633]